MAIEVQPSSTHEQPAAEPVHQGECFCGAVAVEVRGQPLMQGYCHCQSCRTMSGAPLRGFTIWPKCCVRVTRGEALLKGYNKMGFSDRQHCSECGGQVLIRHPTLGFTDVHSAVLRDFPFEAAMHINYQETVLPIRDGLPKLKDFPAEIGGSGQRIPE